MIENFKTYKYIFTNSEALPASAIQTKSITCSLVRSEISFGKY